MNRGQPARLRRVGSIRLLGVSSRLPAFFPNDSSDRGGVDPFARLAQVLAESLIDHRLVAPACRVGSFSECPEHVVVESFLPLCRGDHRGWRGDALL
jgi:hypothetical protein